MLLAVDIGNSSIDIGVFAEDDSLIMKSKISTDRAKSADEYAVLFQGIFLLNGVDTKNITGSILSSVVPPITIAVSSAIRSLFGIRTLEVGPGIKTGLNIKIDSQTELGADIVANAVSALGSDDGPLMIIDFGTATTITVIDAKNTLTGVIIAPGVRVSLDALSMQASELPDVSIAMPKRLIGKNSRESMNSGVLNGHALMMDGFFRKISDELLTDDLHVIATGGLADTILPLCETSIRYVPDLTLEGLRILYYKNIFK